MQLRKQIASSSRDAEPDRVSISGRTTLSHSTLYRPASSRSCRRRLILQLELMEDRRLLSGGFDFYPLPAYDPAPKPSIVTAPDGNLYFADEQQGIGKV